MTTPGSYYFWKWAENDLAGRPDEVHAALVRGELHPALQPFDARPLLAQIARAAARDRAAGGEWHWEVTPSASPERAHFVFVTCSVFDASASRVRQFHEDFAALGVSGCDEATMQIVPALSPKRNAFITGQLPWRNAYDVGLDDLPFLIRRIDPRRRHPFGVLEKPGGSFVKCFAQGRRFKVEWAWNPDTAGDGPPEHWQAGDPQRLAALGEDDPDAELPSGKDPGLLRYADTLRIFEAFLRDEPRPPQYAWRQVDPLHS